jgi:hypothetical protein
MWEKEIIEAGKGGHGSRKRISWGQEKEAMEVGEGHGVRERRARSQQEVVEAEKGGHGGRERAWRNWAMEAA